MEHKTFTRFFFLLATRDQQKHRNSTTGVNKVHNRKKFTSRVTFRKRMRRVDNGGQRWPKRKGGFIEFNTRKREAL